MAIGYLAIGIVALLYWRRQQQAQSDTAADVATAVAEPPSGMAYYATLHEKPLRLGKVDGEVQALVRDRGLKEVTQAEVYAMKDVLNVTPPAVQVKSNIYKKQLRQEPIDRSAPSLHNAKALVNYA